MSNSVIYVSFFFFSSRRRHTRFDCDWSSDVCSSDLLIQRSSRHAKSAPPVTLLPANARLPHIRRDVRCIDRKSTRLNSSHSQISYAVFCLKKKKNNEPLSL